MGAVEDVLDMPSRAKARLRHDSTCPGHPEDRTTSIPRLETQGLCSLEFQASRG